MSKSIMLVKCPTGFTYASPTDMDKASCYKLGQPVRADIVKQSARSLQHHRLFFALLNLTLDYWEDNSIMTTEAERALIMSFCAKFDQGQDDNLVAQYGELFLRELSESRSNRYDMPTKSMDGLLLWIKDKCDHVELVQTPRGIKRIPKSINFNSMSQEEFNVFYKTAFQVCWKYVLSQNFESELECQQVIEQMNSMG